MQKIIVFAGLVFAVVLTMVAVSRSEIPPQPSLPSSAPPEPITGAPAVSVPGDETARHDPFTPYDVGPRPWQYNDLSPAEQGVADRGRDVTGWDTIHAGYATAAKLIAQQAALNAAATQLGTDGVANAGVVP